MIAWFPDKRKGEEFRDKVIEDFRDSSYQLYNFMFSNFWNEPDILGTWLLAGNLRTQKEMRSSLFIDRAYTK